MQAAVVLIRGLPGSGKTTLAGRLATSLCDRGEIVTLEPDRVGEASVDFAEYSARLQSMGIPAEIHVYRYLCEQTRRGVESDRLVIWNQPFRNREVFESLIRLVSKFDWEPNVLLIELEVDPGLALSRVTKRCATEGISFPQSTFAQYVRDYRSYADLGLPTILMDGRQMHRETFENLAHVLHRAWSNGEAFSGLLAASAARSIHSTG